jgi:hypothetical protein
MSTQPLRPALVVFASLCLLAACAKKGEGEPCTSDSECTSGLACDKHGGSSGKCRTPHGHGSNNDAAATVPPDAGATVPDTVASTPDLAAPGPDTAAPARDTAAPAPDAGVTCAAYCQCLTQTCANQAGYPHASQAACVTACEKLTDVQLTCWQRFCTTAAMLPGDRSRQCEHAWGELGSAECQ